MARHGRIGWAAAATLWVAACQGAHDASRNAPQHTRSDARPIPGDARELAEDIAAPATEPGPTGRDGNEGATDEAPASARPGPASHADREDAELEAPAPVKKSEAKASAPAARGRAPQRPAGTGAAYVAEDGYARGAGIGHGGAALQLLPSPPPLPVDREGYKHTPEADWVNVQDQPLSTFSVDVDTASYSNVRRLLQEGRLPPADAVRVEEMLNYFDYAYGTPSRDAPFALHTEISDCPWNAAHRLVHLGLKTAPLANERTPARNLVFLIDVSGSMQSADKLPLLKQGMGLLARTLRPQDTVAMVVYAGASGLALPPTAGHQTDRILDALEALEAGGSTAGAAGIELAYRVAEAHFQKDAINRVILATDGDFNVGASSEGELARLIEAKRKTGIFLTVLGFGRGNLQDARMETLADKGNGNYAYIDSLDEARKVLVREAGSTLVTVAKDVKLQVEFNPAQVASYRLIGYENRALAARDFNDDRKDAGEVGAGHSVTALYEVVPRGSPSPAAGVDPLRYQQPRPLSGAADSDELMTLKLRYKRPDAARSQLLVKPVRDAHQPLTSASDDFRFAAAVAGFGLKLRGSEHVRDLSLESLRALAAGALGHDAHSDRAGLLSLIRRAQELGLDG